MAFYNSNYNSDTSIDILQTTTRYVATTKTKGYISLRYCPRKIKPKNIRTDAKLGEINVK